MQNKIKLVVVGGVKEEFYRRKIDEFKRAIEKRCAFSIVELKDESIPAKTNDTINAQIKKNEGAKILKEITPGAYVIALCIEGKYTDGKKLGELIHRAGSDMREVVLVIGGSLGLDRAVTDRADYKLSFSKMTFPHQLMRVMLMEQLEELICGR